MSLTGLFSTRVKRLDPNELALVAAQLQQQEALARQQAPQQQVATQQVAQQQAPQQVAQQQAAQQAAVSQASASQAATAQSRTSATAAAATGSSAAIAMPSTQSAPRRAYDYWTSHIAQFKGKYLSDGPSMRPNCGPASVTMALRMIGLDIPGFNGQRSEAVLDKARVIATGTNNTSVGTTDTELERVIDASGAKWSESNNLDEMLGWVKQGIPVVLSGNPSRAWNSRYSSDQVYPFDGGHWVTVSGYDAKTGYYVVNDPLSQIGPIYVSKQELSNYNRAHGGLGIAVFR